MDKPNYPNPNVGFNKTVSTHLDKLGFKDLRNKDMLGSFYEITKIIFDEIISPITNDFSSYSSEPSYDKGNTIKNNDESMMNNDEYSINIIKVPIYSKNDESDESDENDDDIEKKGNLTNDKIDFSQSGIKETLKGDTHE